MNENLQTLISQSAHTDTLVITTQSGCEARREESLERYRPAKGEVTWELIISGYWSQGPYHSGWIAFMLAKIADGIWIVDSISRSAELDDVTEEDVEEGCLNDDQLQAMWETTLEDAQDSEWHEIAAICIGAHKEATAAEMARLLYEAITREGGVRVDEPDDDEESLLDVSH